MGKDREGSYHPPKGKPSGVGKTKATELPVNNLENNLEIAERYTDGGDEVAANVRVRHPNRKTDKFESRSREKSSGEGNSIEEGQDVLTTSDLIPIDAEEITGILTKQDLIELAKHQDTPSISFYLPTHPAGVQVNEKVDQRAFKNMLQDISSSLKQTGSDEATITEMLRPGYDLLKNESFWHYLTDGLAVFISNGIFKFSKLPFAPEQTLVINTSFYLTPLIPAVTTREYFYVLVISKKQAKFYRADAFTIEQIEVEDMPKGMEDVVYTAENENQNMHRNAEPVGTQDNYHGYGNDKHDDKVYLGKYSTELDKALWKKILGREQAPLILAGVEYLLPIYKAHSGYRYIADETLTGNYDNESEQTIHQAAKEKMKAYFEARTNKALDVYGNQSATALTSSILADIIPAAYYGRVDQLFMQRGIQIWGTFDEQENVLRIHDTPEEGDECLSDKALIKTLLHGGDVYVLEEDQMPAQSPMAALMRY